MVGMFDDSPSDVEMRKQAFLQGVQRWKNVEQRRVGLGDGFFVNGEMFIEMQTTLRTIKVAIRLPSTHQQRALNNNMAKAHREPMQFRAGWVEVDIDSEDALENALTLARQGYMAFGR